MTKSSQRLKRQELADDLVAKAAHHFAGSQDDIRELQSFGDWLKEVSPTWEWDWDYLVYIRGVLEKVRAGEIRQVMLFVPPRHGKSEMTTVRFPMHWLEQNPALRIIIGAYNATLACKFSRKMKRIGKGRIHFAADRKAVDDWETEEGGGVRAVGVGGGVTGMGAHLIIIDDPVKSRAEANSQTYRDHCYEWYTDDLFTRQEPGCVLILIMTRWHEDDLAGRILASEDGPNWTVISLPAFAEESDPLGRKLGQALCPERYDEAALRRIQRVLRDSFNALFQQRPTSGEGDLFKSIWFDQRYRTLPELKEIATFWDTAQTEKKQNDETACITVGLGVDGNLYILRLCHGRWETPALEKFLRSQADWFIAKYGALYRGDYIEDKANGSTLIQYVRASRPDLAIIPISVEADKVGRANGVTPMCEAGSIRLPDVTVYTQARTWVGDLLGQLMKFPLDKHDDMVDAFVYAIKWLMKTLRIKKTTRGKGNKVV